MEESNDMQARSGLERVGLGGGSGASAGAGASALSEWLARSIPVCSSSPVEGDIRLLRGGKAFLPWFCPNRRCRYHQHGALRTRWYARWGCYHSRCFGRVQRYRCFACGETFSEMSFSLDLYVKRRADYRRLERVLREGGGMRASARHLGVSTGTVANRLERLARSAFCALSRIEAVLAHRESLAFDGFRSFCVSQHAPCDITLLVGRESDYLYCFDYAPLRRGGTMRADQRRARERFERFMRADPAATEGSVTRLFDVVARTTAWPPPQGGARELWSDRHPAYHRAWQAHGHLRHAAERGWVVHRTVSSRAARTAGNPLRAVNYYERELRKDLAEHHRESVCFARTPYHMLARFAVYAAAHNFDKPRRITGSRSPAPAERCHTSHAVAAGAPPAAIERAQVYRFTCRPFLSREAPGEFAELWWTGRIPTPPNGRSPKVPNYALA